MLILTTFAARQIHESAEQSGSEELGLRVAARLDENGDIEYTMGFDEERHDDIAFVEKGINFLVDRTSASLIDGTTLDFVEYQPEDFRFIFVAPTPAPTAPECSGGGCNRCAGR